MSISFVSPRLLHVEEEEADGSAPALLPVSGDSGLPSLVNSPTPPLARSSDPPLPERRRGIQLCSAMLDKEAGQCQSWRPPPLHCCFEGLTLLCFYCRI